MKRTETLYGNHWYADICPRTKGWTQGDLMNWAAFYTGNVEQHTLYTRTHFWS